MTTTNQTIAEIYGLRPEQVMFCPVCGRCFESSTLWPEVVRHVKAHYNGPCAAWDAWQLSSLEEKLLRFPPERGTL